MRTLLFILVTAFCATAFGADAGPVDAGATVVKAATEAEPEAPVDIVPDGVAALKTAIDDWRNIGAVAGLLVIVGFLMRLLKAPVIDIWFVAHKKKWAKPYIAMVLGGLLGGLSTYQTGAGVINSVIAGIGVGLASSGAHESIKTVQRKERRER